MKRAARDAEPLSATHVVPLNDLREHEPTIHCWCCPVEDRAAPDLWVHNALDKRELYESGDLLPH